MTKRIVIVDDNAIIRRLLPGILESPETSWVVSAEARDGREGIQKISELKPDVAVLDLAMPVMNGLEAARVLSETVPQVPLILFSLHVDSILEREASTAGIRAVVSKAENMQVLVSKVRTLLGS
jgi:DNA-binding NarL/FixJ family response regulator